MATPAIVAHSSDTSTFLIPSFRCLSLRSISPPFFDSLQIAAQFPKTCALPSDSCKSRTSWSPPHCSKPSPSFGPDSPSQNDEQIPDSLPARKSSQESDLGRKAFEKAAAYKTKRNDASQSDKGTVRKAFEKAAAYKTRRNDASQSDKGTSSIADATRIPDLLSTTSRTPVSPELPPVAEADASSSSGVDATRSTNTTPPPAFPELELSKEDSPPRAASQDDTTMLSGTWKEESRKDKQESEMVSALSMGGLDAGEVKAQEDSSNNLEVEIFTRDGVIRRKVLRPDQSFSKSKELKRSGVNSLDFLGLDFSEKKPAGKPAVGLSAALEAPSPGTLPEVEIITRDGSKLDEVNKGGLYKPKVSTWGIFERPENISQTYGGGRVIMPGEQLETKEQKESREARTKQLLDAYRKKIGLDVDPKTKADCIKALKQGNDLLDKGELQNAISFFEKVMQQMPYQSELHGSAALQWSVCLDSMNRFQEARSMYEKIAAHPNDGVRKRAKELLFGFQAMKALKMPVSSTWDATLYRKYFDAFSGGYDSLYKASIEEKDGAKIREQTYLYLGVLMFPLILVFYLIISKNT